MDALNCTLLSWGTKRKRATRFRKYFSGAFHPTSPRLPGLCLASQKYGKRKRLEDCKGRVVSCGRFSSKRSLLQFYWNFKKTGIPKRIMYFQKGEWTDFPRDLIVLIRKDLRSKKPAIEVEIDGQSFLLDFLHMFRLELETGEMQPIGWIDEADCCFFPEAFTGGDEACRCCEREYATDGQTGKSVEDIQEKEINLNLVPENPFLYGKFNEQLDSYAVESMFLMGMNPCGGVNILEIRPCSSTPYRLERFLEQVKFTKKYRGTANVQRAWLASSKAALSTIMKHGLVHCGLSAIPHFMALVFILLNQNLLVTG
ncbi:hypothetical protein V6N12_038669 [Hibiscus sabdariffa]|uniref:WWE domain-containing protein n=1 Tax=Hibiscus sabdariffa TaxID=183260 RepID=A0ABR2CAG9_9ROSI